MPGYVVTREFDQLTLALSHYTDKVEQGTSDAVYSVANAEEEIKLFVNSPDAKLVTVEDGQHFLSASHPKEVDNALIDFVTKWHK